MCPPDLGNLARCVGDDKLAAVKVVSLVDVDYHTHPVISQ